MAEKVSLFATVTVPFAFWMWCISGDPSRSLSSSQVIMGAGFPVAEQTAVRRPSVGGWESYSTVSSEIAESKKRRHFLHSMASLQSKLSRSPLCTRVLIQKHLLAYLPSPSLRKVWQFWRLSTKEMLLHGKCPCSGGDNAQLLTTSDLC